MKTNNFAQIPNQASKYVFIPEMISLWALKKTKSQMNLYLLIQEILSGISSLFGHYKAFNRAYVHKNKRNTASVLIGWLTVPQPKGMSLVSPLHEHLIKRMLRTVHGSYFHELCTCKG
jgi:hypothetical protein